MPPRALVRRRAKRIGLVVLVILLIGAAWTIYANLRSRHRTEKVSQQNSQQFVTVVHATRQGGEGDVVLPATLRGNVESPIYARANGYVVHWYADIGARVVKGQLLALLDTPEVDQEWAQAVAQRQQTTSALALAKTSADRSQQLRQRDAVSQQELDDRTGSYQQARANEAAADANVQRLAQLRAFKRILAPFTGVVTQRNIDVGDLIAAGNGTTRAMFVLAQSDPLRVYVSVPQAYSTNVALGQQVTVRQAELPGKTFSGAITHTSAAIDVPTRSLQIEITLPNHDGLLLPGAYVQVTLPRASGGRWIVPGNTLLFRAEGPRLATVGADNHVHLLPVVIAQDTGKTLEIDNGITASDRIIVNPGDALAEGDAVTIAPPKAAPKASATQPASASQKAAT
ncbi:efflux RND transporter periplasmic adaptor subunit [Robbsia sp. Bb-Pol-6]|uniref:Efflux RND transporter periplasmic adaptor subunit n=1 Tax=Robbsia betulipollinis TaxID=2981849 RepID=A0ABT3ZSS5_9BURK|nr:efflux RND transporter periplasmic adaptor subunit [Robbsia betulipollinis]MCY0388938.1 efflux RND transporter periplasmic adaptor subunit [Robbsia betulipollinis]